MKNKFYSKLIKIITSFLVLLIFTISDGTNILTEGKNHTFTLTNLNVNNWILFIPPIIGLLGIYMQIEKQKIKKNIFIIKESGISNSREKYNCIIEETMGDFPDYYIIFQNIVKLNITDININIKKIDEKNKIIDKKQFVVQTESNGKRCVERKKHMLYNEEFKMAFPLCNCQIKFQFTNELGIVQEENLLIRKNPEFTCEFDPVAYLNGFNEMNLLLMH